MEPFSWQLQQTVEETTPLPSCALRRFRSPLPASMLLVKETPSHLAQRRKFRVTCVPAKGPYTISGNWWDEKAWERAEWDLELENGALCQCHASEGRWELDGIYD